MASKAEHIDRLIRQSAGVLSQDAPPAKSMDEWIRRQAGAEPMPTDTETPPAAPGNAGSGTGTEPPAGHQGMDVLLRKGLAPLID